MVAWRAAAASSSGRRDTRVVAAADAASDAREHLRRWPVLTPIGCKLKPSNPTLHRNRASFCLRYFVDTRLCASSRIPRSPAPRQSTRDTNSTPTSASTAWSPVIRAHAAQQQQQQHRKVATTSCVQHAAADEEPPPPAAAAAANPLGGSSSSSWQQAGDAPPSPAVPRRRPHDNQSGQPNRWQPRGGRDGGPAAAGGTPAGRPAALAE